MKWKLYYHDHSTFSSEDGDWSDAPAWGVMAVAIADQHAGRIIDSGRPVGCGDYYIWPVDADEPWWVDCGGLWDHLIRSGLMTADNSLKDYTPAELIDAGVKFGRSVSNEEWGVLGRWIIEDADETWGYGTDERPEPPPISG